MMFGRKKCIVRGTKPQKVMPHNEFMDRIRKSLYFGSDILEEEMEVSRPLAEYASEIFSEPHKGHSLHRLSRVAAGSVHTTPCSLIMALIYLDRLNATDPAYVRCITPHELFIVSMIISTKLYAGYDEEIYYGDYLDDINVPDDKLKQMQLDFLSAIDWNIYISNEEFFRKLENVEETLARREGLRRGWLTYTELVQMLPNFTIVKFLIHNMLVMTFSYAASVITIAGAFFLASQIPGTSLHRCQQQANKLSSTSAGDCNSTLLPTEAVLEQPQDHLVVHVANSSTSATSGTIAMGIRMCGALDVDAELRKLEQQYAEDALREDRLKRNNEQTADDLFNHLDLAVTQPRQASTDLHRNWLSLKGEYSASHEYNGMNMQPPSSSTTSTETNEYAPPKRTRFEYDEVLGNSTIITLWRLLANTAENSFLRLPPLLWFKFM